MRQQEHVPITWTVVEVRDEAPGVHSLILKNETPPAFTPGQYLTVRLPGFEPAEGKSYSISSSRNDPFVRITVKVMGRFSAALAKLEAGDTLVTSVPYGFFYPEEKDRTLVFLAGGIGIAPIRSIVGGLKEEGFSRSIHVFHSNRTAADIVFEDELERLAVDHPELRMTYHITREEPKDPEHKSDRMNGPSILTVSGLDADFFICGSIDFTKGMWKELRSAGVPQERIYTEGFF